MKCTLTRLEGGSSLRTSTIKGACTEKPVVGKCFEMHAKPLDPKATIRVVNTSEIVEIVDQDNVEGVDLYLVRTRTGSLYRIEVDEKG